MITISRGDRDMVITFGGINCVIVMILVVINTTKLRIVPKLFRKMKKS